MYKIKLETFEGPLDLLLQLIEQEELDITNVSLAQVTEQYLTFLNKAQDIPMEELADFLVVAAKLLYIKSKAMLPYLTFDEEEGVPLEQQLKIYKEFYDASRILHKMILRRHFAFSRDRALVRIERIFNPPHNLTTDKMRELFLGVLHSIEPFVSLAQEVMQKTISIQEKIQNIRSLMEREAVVNFRNVLKESKNKTEVIVTFLALLELVKQRTLAVTQEGIFSEIVLKRIQ